MFLMSNSTKICNVFNKYKSKIVQLNFKIKVVSLPGNKDKFPPEASLFAGKYSIQYRFHPLWS